MELVAPDLELFRGHKFFGELFHDGGSHAYVRQTDFTQFPKTSDRLFHQ